MGLNKKSHAIRRLPLTGKTAFVLAHPDDETVTGVGYLGKLGRLARFKVINRLLKKCNQLSGKLPRHWGLSVMLSKIRAVETPVMYYATMGENGKHNGVREEEDLSRVRFDELQQAAKILRAKINIGHFHDGSLIEAHKKLEERIFEFLEREKPDRVITFPPTGITGHLDHREISFATLKAVEKYNQQHPEREISLFFRVIHPGDREITGPYIYHDELPITHRSKVSKVLFSKKKICEVIQAHRTQVPEMGTIFTAFRKFAKQPLDPPHYKGERKKIWKEETFYQRI